MKALTPAFVVVALLTLAVTVGFARSASSATSVTRIDLTAKVTDSSFGNAGFARRLQVWSRHRSPVPIGNAFLNCSGLMLGGVDECRLMLVMPLGKLTAYGVVHSLREMWLVVTGGSRFYRDTMGGTVHIYEDPFDDDYVLNFRLG